ncbi:MAG: DJ-1/PfpI family protein [Candidatus Buchananbacteria bacterium]|nr:DJ-1/PfpI family protein [Candidatus Buchananbacteria bacterium]
MKKKIAFVFPQKDFKEAEFKKISQFFKYYSVELANISATRNDAVADSGLAITPDLAIPEVEVDDFFGLVLIGSPQSYGLPDHDQIIDLIQNFKKGRKVMGAMGFATGILAEAGVVIGKTVTGSLAEEQNLLTRGAEYTGMECEVDGNIVTARDEKSAEEFVKKIAYLLEV